MTATLRREELDAVYDRWQALMPDSSVDSVFVAPHVQRIWWRHFGSGLRQAGPLRLGRSGLPRTRPARVPRCDPEIHWRRRSVRLPRLPGAQGLEPLFFGLLCDYLAKLEWDAVELSLHPGRVADVDLSAGRGEGQGH